MERMQQKELHTSASNLKGAYNALIAAEEKASEIVESKENNSQSQASELSKELQTYNATVAEAERLFVQAHDNAEIAFQVVPFYADKIEATRLRVLTLLCR